MVCLRDSKKNTKKSKKNTKKSKMTRVGFEPTHISVVEIQAGLKSTALDHSAIVSDGEIDKKWLVVEIYSHDQICKSAKTGDEGKCRRFWVV
jgi:hypothetical protein